MDSVITILVNFGLQMAFTIGLIFIFGKLIAICNAKFYSNFGSLGTKLCYITGVVGTPIHELSHALFCVVFGHKIKEIKLFQISDDGTLGYVNHSYNPKNIYHKIGNFFIGIAPIIVGFLVLLGLFYLLMPDVIKSTIVSISAIDILNEGLGSIKELLNVFVKLFDYISTWQFWVFILIGSFIALHMTLSSADIKGSLSGIIFVLVIFLLLDIILAFVSQNILQDMTKIFILAGTFMLFFFMLFLIIAVILLLISFIFKTIKRKLIK